MNKKLNSRRTFIIKCLGLSSLATGEAIISSCNNSSSDRKEQKNEPGSGNCDDLSEVSKAEIEKREKLNYVKESTVPGSNCGNCHFYIPPKSEGQCGGCLLFDGPVRSTGYCTQYVKKSEA